MVSICVAGAINWDINLYVERFPEIGEEIPVETISRVPGGKAANVSVASSRILGPNQVALIGALGKDLIAKKQVEILKAEGVVVSGLKFSEEFESGQAYIIIDKNGRNIINTLFGANLRLLPTDLQRKDIVDLIRSSSIVTLVDPPLQTLENTACLAKNYGKTVVWDAGVRSIMGIEKVVHIIGSVDYLSVNEVEVKNLTGEENPRKAWKILSKIAHDLNLIVKLGARGCLLLTPEYTFTIPPINLDSIGMQVINTVGCGDAFLGVFIASKIQGLDDKESLERANLAGALKATKLETRGSPTRDELEKHLKYKKSGKTIISK